MQIAKRYRQSVEKSTVMDSSAPPKTPQILSQISNTTLTFINNHFKKPQHLSTLPPLLSQLKQEYSNLNQDLDQLIVKLSAATSHWISRSDEIRTVLHDPLCPDANARIAHRQNEFLMAELAALEKDVRRIDAVRLYAETALKLEVLVGELEDATLFITKHTSRSNSSNFLKASNHTEIGPEQTKVSLALKAMNQIEEILMGVARSKSHWTCLLMVVDSRVEKALAILRPKLLSNHRTLLASLGWPPSLSTSNTEKGNCVEIPNPLIVMVGEKKEKYSQSFLELCALQHLQVRRTRRQNDLRHQKEAKLSNSVDPGKQPSFKHGLWAIDELVNPIASRMEYHFSQWSDEPKFIFALVYKTTRDFLDGVDNILQPLIDKALLVGCSAKEAWVSSMVKMLSKYLGSKFFSYLATSYDSRAENMEINSLWVHLVDLMINFDKKMQVLATSGNHLTGPFAFFEGISQCQQLFSIFDDHPDWLQIWAEIELKEAQQKLNLELADERSWLVGIKQQNGLAPSEEAYKFLLSTREDFKAPLIADSVVKLSWSMIERGQHLPSKSSRIQFIRLSTVLFLNHFFIFLLQRSQDMDFTTAILEDDDLLTAAGSINTARYCEAVLNEWNEDISILEMNVNTSFFRDEVRFLIKLQTDCLVEIVSALLLQFDALSFDYIHCIEQWAREGNESEDRIISPEFVDVLEMLRDRLRILRLNLNPKDFLDLWRSAAEGIDHFIFSSIPFSDVNFSRHGIDQFKVDMGALFIVFKPFCARPEAFFPCTNDSLKVLSMDREDADHLFKVIRDGGSSDECLRMRGFFHVSVGQAEKIFRNRKF